MKREEIMLLKEPLDTIPTHDRFGLVTIKGVDYQIVDIGLRMLEPESYMDAKDSRMIT